MYAQDIVTIGELMEIKNRKCFYQDKAAGFIRRRSVYGVPSNHQRLAVMLETDDVFTLRFYRPMEFTHSALSWRTGNTKDDIRLCRFRSCTEGC